MKRTATVVGAGIGGPVAAIMLDRAGYEVTLHEARKGPEDFNSLHELTLDEDTFGSLLKLGIARKEISRYSESPFVSERSYGREGMQVPWASSRSQPMDTNVMWDDLHDALVKRCTVTYGSHVDSLPDTDVIIWADGVGSYGRRVFSERVGTYAGEMLFRGYAPRKDSDMTWYMSASRTPAYQMVSYPCWDRSNAPQRGWTIMLNNQHEPWGDTEILTPAQQDRLNRACRPIMHDTPYELVSTSVETTGSPQLVWTPARQAVYQHEGKLNYLLGDALGTVSPRTSLGANLAVSEGMRVTRLIPGKWDNETLREVNFALRESREYIQAAH